MTSSPIPTSASSPMPHGLRTHLPDVIITRRTRTLSMSGRISDESHKGTVRFFCRSRGHGFIDDDDEATNGGAPLFMHISDIDGEYIPRKGDRVCYQTCPMPPRFDKPQAVCIRIVDFTPETHHRWCEKETAQELAEDREAMAEEERLNASLRATPPSAAAAAAVRRDRASSGGSVSGSSACETVPEASDEA